MLACKQALLFGRAKQAAWECTSERSPLRVYFLRYPQLESLLAGYIRLWCDTSYNKWFIKIKQIINDDFKVAYPHSGSLFTWMMVKLEFEKVWFLFEERRKPEYPGKKLSEQKREPATHSTHMWHQHQDLKPAILAGGECSHHCATLALLPLLQFIFYFPFWLFIKTYYELNQGFHRLN